MIKSRKKISSNETLLKSLETHNEKTQMRTDTCLRLMSILNDYTYSIYILTFAFRILGHCLNILVYTQLKIFRNHLCIFYLTIESIVNMHGLLFNSIHYLLTVIFRLDFAQYSSLWCKVQSIIEQTIFLLSITSICLSTSSLIFVRRMYSYCWMIVLTCFSFGHSIYFGIFFYSKSKLLFHCTIDDFFIHKYYVYFFYPILVGVLPMTISSVFSILSWRKIHRFIRQKRIERQLARFILICTIFFLSFITLMIIYRMDTYDLIVDQSLLNFHYSISFYLFCFASSRYRRQIKYILIKKYWQKLKKNFSNINQIHLPTTICNSDD